MISKQITYFGQSAVIACDALCSKAWGINNRPQAQLSDNEDDYEYLADGELGVAPIDPGTYEGGHAKPAGGDGPLNKWCCRECERCVMVKPNEVIVLPDFSRRRKNIGETLP